jgi:hypothetical protein
MEVLHESHEVSNCLKVYVTEDLQLRGSKETLAMR